MLVWWWWWGLLAFNFYKFRHLSLRQTPTQGLNATCIQTWRAVPCETKAWEQLHHQLWAWSRASGPSLSHIFARGRARPHNDKPGRIHTPTLAAIAPFSPTQRGSFAVSPKPQTHRLDRQTETDHEKHLIDGSFVQPFITNNGSCDSPKVYLSKYREPTSQPLPQHQRNIFPGSQAAAVGTPSPASACPFINPNFLSQRAARGFPDR